MTSLAFIAPLVWATPTTARIGVDEPLLTLKVTDTTHARVLQLIHDGTSRNALDKLARRSGLGASQLESFIATLRPVLLPRKETPSPASRLVVLDRAANAAELAKRLARHGLPVSLVVGEEPPECQIVITVDRFAYDTHRLTSHTIRGARVLPLLFTDRSLTIGPLLSNGEVCPGCLSLHLDDTNPEWQPWAHQIVGAPLRVEQGEAAALIPPLVTTFMASAQSPELMAEQVVVQLSSSGGVTELRRRHVTSHASCSNHAEIAGLTIVAQPGQRFA